MQHGLNNKKKKNEIDSKYDTQGDEKNTTYSLVREK